MAKILIFLFIYTFSFSDTVYNGICIKNFYTNNNKQLYIQYSKNNTISRISYKSNTFKSLVDNLDKFTYDSDNNKCVLSTSKQNSNFLNVSNEQFNFLFALFGILLGNTVLSIFGHSMNRR